MESENVHMQTGFDPRTASPAALNQARNASFEEASPAGRRAQGAFALWAAANRLSIDDTNRIIVSEPMQFALKLPDVSGVDIAQAVERASHEVGAWSVYDLLRQPIERLNLIMAVDS
jgi:hypothetical protein